MVTLKIPPKTIFTVRKRLIVVTFLSVLHGYIAIRTLVLIRQWEENISKNNLIPKTARKSLLFPIYFTNFG